MSNEAAKWLYSAFSRDWTIETSSTVNADGTVTTEGVTVESVVDAIRAEEHRATVERIRATVVELGNGSASPGRMTYRKAILSVLAILEREAQR